MTRQETIRFERRNLAYWTAGWLVTMAFASFGPTLLWDGRAVPTLLVILLNTLIGLGMIVANKRYLMSLDEMQQRLHLESMGVALGVGLVVGLSYSNLDISNMIAFDAEISHLVMIIALTYIATLITLTRKYA